VNVLTAVIDVLIIDDEPDTVEDIKLLLRSKGYVVELLSEPRAAMSALGNRECRFLLLDWTLSITSDDEQTDVRNVILHELKTGGLGPLNQAVPFAVVTGKGPVLNTSLFSHYPGFIDSFYKVRSPDDVVSAIVDQLSPDRADELRVHVPQARWRTFVVVESVLASADGCDMEIWICNWREDAHVKVPLRVLPPELQDMVSSAESYPVWLIARANLGARTVEELGLAEFELAPGLEDDGEDDDD
jgi:CheY-like chemotaxis protein